MRVLQRIKDYYRGSDVSLIDCHSRSDNNNNRLRPAISYINWTGL